MNNYRQITVRYLKQNKKRTILTIIGIVLAVSLFSAIGTFFYSFQNNIIELEKSIHGNYEVSYKELNKKDVNTIKNNFNVKNFGVEQTSKSVACLENNQNVDLNINFSDENYFKNIRKFDVIEGSIPKNSNELLLERKAIRKLNKKVGDSISFKVDNEEKTYKISGFYKPQMQTSTSEYNSYGFLDNGKLKSNANYNVFINLKEDKNIRNIGKSLGKDLSLKDNQIQFNEPVLNAMMQVSNNAICKTMKGILMIVIPIIILCTVAVIYNSFNISVTERIKQFGILRSIGASPSKIRRIVFKEAIIMCLIAIPLGIVLGHLGLYTVVEIILRTQSKSLGMVDVNLFKINFYPKVILISSTLGFITVFLSVIIPAKMASKISPIDAIRDSSKFKKGKIKRRKARLIKFIFRIEGQVAYRNIRRNNKRFLITVFSLSISFVMFVTFTSFLKIQNSTLYDYTLYFPYDAYIQQTKNDKGIDSNAIEEIKKIRNVKEVYAPELFYFPLFIEDSFVNKNFVDVNDRDIEKVRINKKEYLGLDNTVSQGFDENSLKACEKHLVDGKIDIKALENGGVILLDTNKKRKSGKDIIDRFTNYKVGDVIKIPRQKINNKKHEVNTDSWKDRKDRNKECIEKDDFINAKVVAIINKNPIENITSSNKVDIIFDKKVFEKYFGERPIRLIGMTFKNNTEKDNAYFEDLAEENDADFLNFQEMKKQNDSLMILIETFIYGFISIISLIAVLNIINTITMGLLLRKKEFATLSAIGMTKKQLSKMVLLEGLLYGVIVSVFGSIISYGLIYFMLKATLEVVIVKTVLPIIIFVIGIIGVVSLTFIASLIPLRKFKKMNIIENIKEEE